MTRITKLVERKYRRTKGRNLQSWFSVLVFVVDHVFVVLVLTLLVAGGSWFLATTTTSAKSRIGFAVVVNAADPSFPRRGGQEYENHNDEESKKNAKNLDKEKKKSAWMEEMYQSIRQKQTRGQTNHRHDETMVQRSLVRTSPAPAEAAAVSTATAAQSERIRPTSSFSANLQRWNIVKPGHTVGGLTWRKKKTNSRNSSGAPPSPPPSSSVEETSESPENDDNKEEEDDTSSSWMLLVQILGENRQNELRNALQVQNQENWERRGRRPAGRSGNNKHHSSVSTTSSSSLLLLDDEEEEYDLDLLACANFSCSGFLDLLHFPEFDHLAMVRTIQPCRIQTVGTFPYHQQLRGGDGVGGRAQNQNNHPLHSNHHHSKNSVTEESLLPEEEEIQQHRDRHSRALQGMKQNEAFQALEIDKVRQEYGLSGAGIKIGVLSDSFDMAKFDGALYAEDLVTGDLLHSNIQILQEPSSGYGNYDEGRAMIQLLYDLVPNATFLFHSAVNGLEGFAQGIQDLADAGCHIIVDDIIYYSEQYFQDGLIAQSAQDVVEKKGVAYFSSAGNNGQNSWQSPFVGSGIFDENGCEYHVFGPPGAGDIDQTIDVNYYDIFSLQWDDASYSVSGEPGAQTDLNLYVYDMDGTLLMSSSLTNETGVDPWIAFFMNAEGNVQIRISHCAGPKPNLMKYILFGLTDAQQPRRSMEYGTDSSTCFGHGNGKGVAGVGATFFQNTPRFGTNPPKLELFSSSGGTPIYIDRNGARLKAPQGGKGYHPEVRHQPRFVAVDGVSNTFFGRLRTYEPNGFGYYFFGTSAAVPNAAGVAALVIEAAATVNVTLTPAELYDILEQTAVDMLTPGFDFQSGHGFLNASAAVNYFYGSLDSQ